jgi:hypothetical protein
MNMQEKLGRIRAIGYAVGIVVIIVAALWRSIPHPH